MSGLSTTSRQVGGRRELWRNYAHTVLHLRPVQVASRLWLSMNHPRVDDRTRPSHGEFVQQWQAGPPRASSMTGPRTLRFLNREATLDGQPMTWQSGAPCRLWQYNLHYFDDLHSEGHSQREEWHRALISDWVVCNLPHQGPGWESYPLSRRIVNWLKCYLERRPLPEEAWQSLAVQLRYLQRRLEYHLLGNHLLANAKALIFGGCCFTGPEAYGWLDRGARILEHQLREQILSDGGHIERSPMYHALVLEDLLDIHQMAEIARLQASRAEMLLGPLGDVIEKMRRWLATMQHPDGEIAFFNDAAMGIAPTPAALDDYALRLGFPALVPAQARITPLVASGYVRLESGPSVLLVDVAPLGPEYLPGHAHADTLSCELSLDGRRWLVNSGTSTYSLGAQREAERATASHNTVTIDGMSSSEMWAGFRVARRAHPLDVSWRDEREAGLVVEGAHDGYCRLKGSPKHRRQWRLSPERLTVLDVIEGEFGMAEARWYLHPRIEVSVIDSGERVLLRDGSREARWQVAGGGWRIEEGEYHPQFGVSEPTGVLVGMFHGARLQQEFIWSPRASV